MHSKKLVIKIGSNVICGNGAQVDLVVLSEIARQVVALKRAGWCLLIVSSGAVAVGRSLFADRGAGRSISFLAAAGQAALLNHYHNLFSAEKEIIAQVLLTGDDFLERERYNFIYETLSELLAEGVIPIINENDVVTRDYWGFGENDFLAAMTAVNIGADKIVFLTNIDGVYNRPPVESGAKLLAEIDAAADINRGQLSGVSTLGKGGMESKLSAAQLAANAGIDAYIVNGLIAGNLEKVAAGESVGTHFKPKSEKLNQKKGWLFIGRLKPGKILVDDGAALAVKAGRSLLAVGVRAVKGDFHQGDVVSVWDLRGHTIGYGKVNYDSDFLRGIFRVKRDEIKNKYQKEVIHRDNLTILK